MIIMNGNKCSGIVAILKEIPVLYTLGHTV